MIDIDRLKKVFCDYFDTCKEKSLNIDRAKLKDFVNTLPHDLFIQKSDIGYKVFIKPEEVTSFVEFMISCGFGDNTGFYSNAQWIEERKGFIFNTDSNKMCEFIVKDGLRRRYSINLDDIPVEDGIKHVILSGIKESLYNVSINFTVDTFGEVTSESSNQATFDYNNLVRNKTIDQILGIKSNDNILKLETTRGDIPKIVSQLEEGRFEIVYPVHGRITLKVKSSDSESYVIYKKACDLFSTILGDKTKIVKLSLNSCENGE